jgi:glycosyltransferase involved in cell wall biosynthesis
MPDGQVFIVIAAYNEAEAIRHVVDGVRGKCENIVIVDDGSTDDTTQRLRGCNVFLLRHVVNRGQGAALQTGIEFALARGADIIVTFDADGQHDSNDIPAMLRPILAGECDVTLGSRFLGRAHGIPFSRKLLLKAGVLFTRTISRTHVTDIHNGLRAFSRRAAASLQISLDRMAHASEILDQVQRAGWRYKEVPVNIFYSPYSLIKGQSSWNALRIASQVLIRKVLR